MITSESLKTPPYSGVRPEAQLLLDCACRVQDQGVFERVQMMLHGQLDWDYLMRLAGFHHMQPLLFWTVNKVDPHAAPEAIFDTLREHFQNNGRRNLIMVQELLEILRRLEDDKIEAVPFKGPLLAGDLYSNLSLRVMADLDILIRKQDLERVKSMLLERGYRLLDTPHEQSENRRLRVDCEVQFLDPTETFRLEVHWQFFPKHSDYFLDTETLWERTIPVRLAGRPIKTLAHEDLFYYLCLHGGNKHQWAALRFICDVARMIEVYPELDWQRIMKLAQDEHRERSVFLALHLSEKLLGAEVPELLRQSIAQDPQIGALAALARGRLFRPDFGLPGFAEWRYYMLNCGHLANRNDHDPSNAWLYMHYLLAITRPEFNDREMLPALPRSLSFIHYFTRPFRLIFNQKSRLLDRLR